MPISKYFEGKGKQVMSDMKKTYDDPEKAKQVFYATANKQGLTARAAGWKKNKPE